MNTESVMASSSWLPGSQVLGWRLTGTQGCHLQLHLCTQSFQLSAPLPCKAGR